MIPLTMRVITKTFSNFVEIIFASTGASGKLIHIPTQCW